MEHINNICMHYKKNHKRRPTAYNSQTYDKNIIEILYFRTIFKAN